MRIKVLIIEDDEDDFIIVKHYLSKISTTDYDVYWSSDFDFALEDILKNEHDIYLIDHFLGKGEGLDLIKSAREALIDKPLILLTGAKNESVDQEAMKKGASDFIIKSEVKVETLERTLRYAIERYKQQKSIKEKEKKYRSLFELSMEPVVILDHDFHIMEYNSAFSNMFFKGQKEIPRNFKTFFLYDFDYRLLLAKIEEDGYVKGWRAMLNVQSERKTVILSLAALPNDTDPSRHFFHVAIHDVTKLMSAQSEIQRMEKLSMTGRMARIIAHEVRNPLTNINLAIGELKEIVGDGNEDVNTYSEMISRNADRIAKLIDDLLTSAKPGNLEIVPATMNHIVESAIEFCKDRINLKNVEFNYSFDNPSIKGRWDPEKLKIAFINIMINAIEAMSETESPKLLVHLGEENGSPTIKIEDNGKGMDEETQQNLFEPFFSKRKDGLGLGMTATHNIISMHKGRINVKSTQGAGTEFVVVL
jgi:signal transduction histidine kinase